MSKNNKKEQPDATDKDFKKDFKKGGTNGRKPGKGKPQGKGKNRFSPKGNFKYNGGDNSNGDSGNTNAPGSNNSNSVVSHANDVTWYTKNQDQVKSAASISFMNALGMNTNEFSNADRFSGSNSAIAVPASAAGVMRVGYVPTFGNPRDPHDAMNIAVTDLFAQVRTANSGKTNYEKADYFKYVILCDMIYSYASFLMRVYGIFNSYSAVNKFWPETFFSAMGINLDDIRANIAQFRLYIQKYISKANTIYVPNNLPIFARHFWMNGNIYKDGDSLWSQTYMFVPEVYARLNINTGDIDFKLIKDIETGDECTQLTVQRMITIGNAMLDDYYESTSMAIMAGDSAKAFGDGARFVIKGIPEDYTIYPVYDPGVVNQFMNSTACGWVSDSNGAIMVLHDAVAYSIHEVRNGIGLAGYANGYLQLGKFNAETEKYDKLTFRQAYTPDGKGEGDVEDMLNAKRYIINVTYEIPTPEIVIESTRTRATGEYHILEDTNRLVMQLDGCGADVFTTYKIFYMQTTDDGKYLLSANQPFTNLIFANPENQAFDITIISNMILLGDFDWHPIIDVITYDPQESYVFNQPYVDKYRLALVHKDVLNNIHDVANLSLFNISQ